MTPLFAARRAAEEFAQLVDAPVDRSATRTGTHGHRAGPHADLLPTVTTLREQTSVTPRAEFVAELRARLMVAADTALAPGPPDRAATVVPLTPRRGTGRIGTAAAAALVVIGGTAGVAVAAQGAVPGDPLYPVKRGLENAVSSLNTSQASKGADLLDEAGTRLAEARTLSQLPAAGSTSSIRATLSDFQDAADQGSELLFTAYQRDHDAEDIATVRQFTDASRGDLDALALTAPPAVRPSIDAALQSLADIDTQATSLCAACGGDLGAGSLGSLGAASFRALITEPVRAVQAGGDAADLRAQQSALARLAERASRDVPQLPLPGEQPAPGNDPQAPAPGQLTPDSTQVRASAEQVKETLAAVTTPVKSTLQGTTDGVTGLIREVTGTTPLAPVTDPLSDTIDQTVDGVTGLLP
jgi:hypothetical protein